MKHTAKTINNGYTILDLWENKEFMRMIMLLETLKGKEKQDITNWLMKMVSIQPKYKGLEKHIITSHNLEDF